MKREMGDFHITLVFPFFHFSVHSSVLRYSWNYCSPTKQTWNGRQKTRLSFFFPTFAFIGKHESIYTKILVNMSYFAVKVEMLLQHMTVIRCCCSKCLQWIYRVYFSKIITITNNIKRISCSIFRLMYKS
jgi:hypothetical protein